MSSVAASNNLLAAIVSCFDSGAFADITIKCGHLSWKAHRLVVCSQSRVLRAAFEGPFQEADSREIDLKDDNPTLVNSMLDFFYKSDYTHDFEGSGIFPLQFHAQMYSLADKYEILGLMNIAKERYKHLLQGRPSLEDYLRSIPEVYIPQASGHELRTASLKFGRNVLKDGIRQENVRTTLREIVDQVPEYGFDILEVFLDAPLRGNCYNCGPDQEAESLQARCRKCGRSAISQTY